jgi:hypothetical protein
MNEVKLSIVIHTEEEFDWSGGFSAKNNQVTHAKELFAMCEDMFAIGCKITFALDYAFVDSEQGQWFIERIKKQYPNDIEFAAHLHPWVTPPLQHEDNEFIEERLSYPGNLSREIEYNKLSVLTEKITEVTGVRPVVYLAGRYGVGQNTHEILSSLGYSIDLSITPFTDYSYQDGPDFSDYDNLPQTISGVTCLTHNAGYISRLDGFSDWLNVAPQNLQRFNKNIFGKVLLKLLGVQRVRLSAEGFSAKQMDLLFQSLSRVGVKHFIYSFHSSTSKLNCSPYSKNEKTHTHFLTNNLAFLKSIPNSVKSLVINES